MIRNLKALGLALVAVFAMSAMAASAAQAEDPSDFVSTDGYPAVIHAYTGNTQTFTSSVGTLTCVPKNGESSVHGTMTLEEPSDTVTGENIEYTNCHATVLQLPVTVNMNECHYTFTVETQVSTSTAEGDVHIECGEKPIEISVFANKTKHAENSPGCIIDVDSQTPTSGTITYHNLTTEDGQEVVTVEADNVVVHSTKTAVGALCSAGSDNSTYNGEFIAEATEGKDIAVTGT